MGNLTGKCIGIYGWGDLTITGAGTLTVTTGNSAEQICCGIYSKANLIISGTVTATAGSGLYSHGIGGNGGVSISGTVTATGGAVSCTASADNYASIGISVAADMFFSDAAQVTATGGTVTAPSNAEAAFSYGIEVGNDVTFSRTSWVTAAGGTVTTADDVAYEGSSYNGSFGILSYKNNMIVSEAAQVTATGGDGSVYCPNGSVSTAGYAIAFDANGGGYMGAATGGPTAYILPANSFIAPDGKPFNCWIVNGTEQAPGAAIDITADTTVTAAWAYTVSFDANGGTGEMTDETGVFGEYTLPENGFAAPEGKQFKGWAASADGEVISGAAIPLSADTILYAIWEDIPVVPAEYAILDGANSNWTLDSGESLSIRGSGEFSQFVGVKVDGTLVDAENYTVERVFSWNSLPSMNSGKKFVRRISIQSPAFTRMTNGSGRILPASTFFK